MFPILATWSVGGLQLQLGSYGALLLLACTAATILYVRLARELGISRATATGHAVANIIGGLVGAKLLGVVVAHLSGEQLAGWRAAGVVHGGIFGGFVTVCWLAYRHAIPLGRALDLTAAPIALGQGIGRLGCFFAGCCYGTPSSGAFAITFDSEVAHARTHVPLGVPIFPVQLVDAAAHLAVAFVVAWVLVRGGRIARVCAGTPFGAWLVAEGMIRMVMESFRGDLDRGALTPFWSTGRVTSAIIISLGLLIVALSKLAGAAATADSRARSKR